MGFTRVALVGASGQLGKHVLQHLLKSTSPRFEITILTRASNENESLQYLEEPSIKVQRVDYHNHQQLVQMLTVIEEIVSALNSVPAIHIDPLLAQAGQEAGVRRIFPSEYTLDVLHPEAVKLMGVLHPRVQHAQWFVSFGDFNDGISFTTIVSGMFLDLAIRGHHGNYDPKEKTATLFDGGNVPATGCSADFIAASVVAALKMPEEETKNKRIHIAEVKYTGRQILEALEEVTKTKFEVIQVTSELLSQKLEKAKEEGLVRETFVLPVVLLNFAKVDGKDAPSGAGLLEDGLSWNAGGFLTQKRKNLIEIAREIV
jgi:tRNA G18 (ribose-2'-O)-methylase SpoU